MATVGTNGIENSELKAAYFNDFAGEADPGHLRALQERVPRYQEAAERFGASVSAPDHAPYNRYPFAVRVSSRERLSDYQQDRLTEIIKTDIHFISGNSF